MMRKILSYSFEFNLFSKYRQALMGIAMLGVLILHGMSFAGIKSNVYTFPFEFFSRIAFTQGFLFLSGLGLYYSFTKTQNVMWFYEKRIKRLMIPFMLMTLPFYLFKLIVGDSSFIRFCLEESSLYFWLYGNNGMWYISVSLMLYFLFPVLYKFMFHKENHIVLRLLVILWLYILMAVGLYFYQPDYYNLVRRGVEQSPMFVIGIFVGYLAFHKRSIKLASLIGGVILVVVTYILYKKVNIEFLGVYEIARRLLFLPLTCLALQYLCYKRHNAILDFFNWFGKYSLEIYVLHILIIVVTQQVLVYIGISEDIIPILHTILTYIIVLLICSSVHNAINRVIQQFSIKK